MSRRVAKPVAPAAAPAAGDGAPERLAAVDIGSNSLRLEIGCVEQGRYRRVLYDKAAVRLGIALDARGELPESAIEVALPILRRFGAAIAQHAPAATRAVATQTVREARNREHFLRCASEALGVPVETISGHEEARLIYVGVALLQPSDRLRLIVDIGGRSTELIVGRGADMLFGESLPIGSGSLTLRHFAGGRLDAAAFASARLAASAALETLAPALQALPWTEALASSGTGSAVSGLLEAAGWSDGRLTGDGVDALIDRCIAAGHVDTLKLPGLKPDRAVVLPGGLAILSALASTLGVAELQPARGALRQGVILDLHQRRELARTGSAPDVRDGAVAALQDRFGVDTVQAARVRAAAVALYDLACPTAPREQRQELAWAAALYEVGRMLSHDRHPVHGAYVMRHADIAGFSQDQQARVAALIGAQDGPLPWGGSHTPLGWAGGSVPSSDEAWPLLCLRLAVLRCHGRTAAVADEGRWQADADGLTLQPKTDAHPQTLHLLAEEAARWAAAGPLRLHVQAATEATTSPAAAPRSRQRRSKP